MEIKWRGVLLQRGSDQWGFTSLGEEEHTLSEDKDSEDGMGREIQQNAPIDVAFCGHWA